jgi:hypothetical protein
MMILRAADEAIKTVLADYLAIIADDVGEIDVYLADNDENKRQMPYIVIQCVSAEEQITPGSGIFKVAGELLFRSHTKETAPETRQVILDTINNFAYDSTAAKLSGIEGFHCHGWHPTTGNLTVDSETHSYAYDMKYWVYCMAIDND